MIEIYTIGFAKKSAKMFFESLRRTQVKTLVDVRLNNVSQLAGYTKRNDLDFFLKEICSIKYIHALDFAPTKEILEDYKTKKISWAEYESRYLGLLRGRKLQDVILKMPIHPACLLCSEPDPKFCHRRLAAEYLASQLDGVKITHL